MSVTVKELKKNYNLNEEQMKKIRDAMDAAQRAIEADIPGRRSHFEQQKRAGAAVTAGVVMVEFQPQMVTERIQLMILQIRICLSAHLAGTQIGSLRLPVDVIVMQAAG